jgi:hypothetical protein
LNKFNLPGTKRLKRFISDSCGCSYRAPSAIQEEPYGFIKRISTGSNGSKLEVHLSSVLTNAQRNPKQLRGETPKPATVNPIADALKKVADSFSKGKEELKRAGAQFASEFFDKKDDKKKDKKDYKKKDDKKDEKKGKKGKK